MMTMMMMMMMMMMIVDYKAKPAINGEMHDVTMQLDTCLDTASIRYTGRALPRPELCVQRNNCGAVLHS